MCVIAYADLVGWCVLGLLVYHVSCAAFIEFIVLNDLSRGHWTLAITTRNHTTHSLTAHNPQNTQPHNALNAHCSSTLLHDSITSINQASCAMRSAMCTVHCVLHLACICSAHCQRASANRLTETPGTSLP